MKQKPRLYLHIGSPKTGSSAIQQFLNYNRKVFFREYSLLYPNFNNENFIEGATTNQSEFFQFAKDEQNREKAKEIFARCIDFCQRNEVKKIVISCESWGWKWWPGFMHGLIDQAGLECNIIVYLRRQDKYLESAWKQWGHKRESCDTIMDYFAEEGFNWNQVLNMWTSYFNTSQFIVRPYERSQIGNNILIDFFKILGINDITPLIDSSRFHYNTNPGLNWDVIEIMRHSKKLLDGSDDNKLIHFMNDMLTGTFIKEPLEDYNLLSPRQRLEVINKYAASNREVARKFLNWHDKELFNDPLPDPDEEWEPPSALTLEKVIPVFMQIMLKQHEQLLELKNQLNKLKRGS